MGTKPSIGRIVHYCCGDNPTVSKPAIIVHVFEGIENGLVNLRVFGNDSMNPAWMTSVVQGDQPGQWHWPVRE